MAQVTGFKKVARFSEPSLIGDANTRSWASSLVRELNLALNDKDIPPPQTVEVNRVLKATGQNVYAWISSDNPVSSGSGDANKFLKTTAANVFTWASVIDVDKVSSGSGDANKFFKTTGANTYAWTSVFEVSAGAGDTAKFLRATGAGAYAFTSITDVSGANQTEMEAAASAGKTKYVSPFHIRYSPHAVKGAITCDVSGRVCAAFGVLVSMDRRNTLPGNYRVYFSPDFSNKGGVVVVPHVVMTSFGADMTNFKTAHATSITASTADILTVSYYRIGGGDNVGVSANDANNQRIEAIVMGDL